MAALRLTCIEWLRLVEGGWAVADGVGFVHDNDRALESVIVRSGGDAVRPDGLIVGTVRDVLPVIE